MNVATDLTQLLDGRPAREVEPGIVSVLPPATPGQRYDRRARAYDRMIGSRLYNRSLWGSEPEHYRAFARRAVHSAETGWLLDAGCGTLLLSAEAYAAAPHRPVVALDHSLGMLRRARERLGEVAGRQPEHIVLLQADLRSLPFRAGSFATVLSMGMLHLFDAPETLAGALQRCLRPGGGLFLSSLVENGRLGDRYLRLLHRAGEVAAPRSAAELERRLRGALRGEAALSVTGNMAYLEARA